jgi:hypothetical protein
MSAKGPGRNRVVAGLGICALLVLVFWAARRDSSTPSPNKLSENTEARRLAALESLREVSSPVARTDRGRQVPLYEMPESALPTGLLTEMERGMTDEWGPALRVIRTGAADRRSDCHGWVFADGQWWMLGRVLKTILEDNGYAAVDEPAAGDLVIYRDGPHEVTHSGVVYAVAPNRRVLIESKWAWLGTHLHRPDDHPYGGRPTYYRSPRAGHRLVISAEDGVSPKPKVLRGDQ